MVRAMRYGRIALDDGTETWARFEGELAQPLAGAPWTGAPDVSVKVPISACRLLAPVSPRKILCVGRNYAAHARELGNEVPKEPMLFLKPPSALLDPGGELFLPRQSERVEHEAELGVVVGSRCKDATPETAMRHVFGYTCACDVTARDLQKKDVQFTRAKGFDGFCPVGPWIETELDPRDLRVTCRVQGAVRQDGRTSAMVFPVPELVAYMSQMMTLEPGDLLLTGTPEGVGPLVAGDALEVAIEGIGALLVHVRAAKT
jgi:2-keto-4-pentenoate hydratase/2-oxohepta-3-ene-1,7-dioic acid hydratase in catechol pathway